MKKEEKRNNEKENKELEIYMKRLAQFLLTAVKENEEQTSLSTTTK
ncbi:hypothetical protein GF360_00950 [candidate division WWE3 bacterium]|nr:hypothetical protein [candidate division WWE3 bacterium]